MPVKPSSAEQEYFAREEAQRLRKAAAEHDAKLRQEERARLRELHFMHCPKCGLKMEEIEFGGVKVDKCFHCEGLFLDKGELEALQAREPGFLGKLVNVFRG